MEKKAEREIEIKGHPFSIDIEAGGLRNKMKPYNLLKFSDMDRVVDIYNRTDLPADQVTINNHYVYRLYFDSEKLEICKNLPQSTELPEHITFMEILSEKLLDPAGNALKNGVEVQDTPYPDNAVFIARELPGFTLDGYQFIVDVAAQKIFQATDPDNYLGFERSYFDDRKDLEMFTIDPTKVKLGLRTEDFLPVILTEVMPHLPLIEPAAFHPERKKAFVKDPHSLQWPLDRRKKSNIIHTEQNSGSRKKL